MNSNMRPFTTKYVAKILNETMSDMRLCKEITADIRYEIQQNGTETMMDLFDECLAHGSKAQCILPSGYATCIMGLLKQVLLRNGK